MAISISKIGDLPNYISPLFTVGLIGSIFRTADQGLSLDSIILNVLMQVAVALIMSTAIYYAMKSSERLRLKQHLFTITFTWVYFCLGLLSFMTLLSHTS